jgi:fructuronate reductase
MQNSELKRPATGIVHLGLGAFFRAFGCIYIADAMSASGGDWGITGVSLRKPDIRDALKAQDWSYTSVTLDKDVEKTRRIDVLNNVLFAVENPEAVLSAMVDPKVKIVSLTVTEKGYCHSPSTGLLNLQHPDIQLDLVNKMPVSALGFLVRALQLRQATGIPPFTVLCCDNISSNGVLVKNLVLELADHIDPHLAEWIRQHGRFPSTMVDRITPATTNADIERVDALIGEHDAAPVLHEPFSQWVVEDKFVNNERPDLGAVGVELVTDVTTHEHMKLRMLNGTHSGLAYTGYLAGHETISDTIHDPVFRAFVKQLWQEITPAVEAPENVSLIEYADSLLERYSNPSIKHRTWQIAMDGSQKLPQRILTTLQDNIAAGRDSTGLLLVVAAWMRYVSGVDEAGLPIDVRDPLAARLKKLCDESETIPDTVTALLSVQEVFPPEIAAQIERLLIPIAQRLWDIGSKAAIEEQITD